MYQWVRVTIFPKQCNVGKSWNVLALSMLFHQHLVRALFLDDGSISFSCGWMVTTLVVFKNYPRLYAQKSLLAWLRCSESNGSKVCKASTLFPVLSPVLPDSVSVQSIFENYKDSDTQEPLEYCPQKLDSLNSAGFGNFLLSFIFLNEEALLASSPSFCRLK